MQSEIKEKTKDGPFMCEFAAGVEMVSWVDTD